VLVDDGTEQCSVAGIDVGLTINGDSILIEEFLAITENNRVRLMIYRSWKSHNGNGQAIIRARNS
jgi:hypothetical protein